MSLDVWLPNSKRYETTYSRLWCHILRNTPKDAKILVVATAYQESFYTKSKEDFDLEQRKITFEDPNLMRGLDPDFYDFILFLEATEKNIEIMMSLAIILSPCKILYREIISPLKGERFININSHWALSSV